MMGKEQFDALAESYARHAALCGGLLAAAVIDIQLEAAFDTDLVLNIPGSEQALIDVANEALTAGALWLATADDETLVATLISPTAESPRVDPHSLGREEWRKTERMPTDEISGLDNNNDEVNYSRTARELCPEAQ